MPEGAVPPSASLVEPVLRPVSVGNGAVSTPLPSVFPPYEVEDDIPRTGTPPPIKVVRAKKKAKTAGSSNGGRKRTMDSSSTR